MEMTFSEYLNKECIPDCFTENNETSYEAVQRILQMAVYDEVEIIDKEDVFQLQEEYLSCYVDFLLFREADELEEWLRRTPPSLERELRTSECAAARFEICLRRHEEDVEALREERNHLTYLSHTL